MYRSDDKNGGNKKNKQIRAEVKVGTKCLLLHRSAAHSDITE